VSDVSSLVSALPVGIPIWDQYVDLLKWVLDGIAGYVGSGGIAILIFTVIVRTLILPVTVKSIRSMKSMQDIQPKMAELKKKYGKDKVRLQEETMLLYRTYGVNPVAGCLPMLLQLPIFLGVYSAISGLSRSDSGVWHGSFWWLDSLGSADPLHILPILAGVFQLVQNQMARSADQSKVTDPQQAMMNTMMNIFPLFSVLFGWTFASGAVLYWVAQGVYGIVQQWFVTGWGRLNLWIPNLPELPEHKRLGYRAPRDLDAIDPNDLNPSPRGPLGRWWHKQMEQAQQISKERAAAASGSTTSAATAGASTGGSGGRAGGKGGSSNGGGSAEPVRARTITKTEKSYKRDSPKGRMLAEQARRSAGDPITVDEEAVTATATPNGSHPARRRPKRAR
jgi:YidC/Oxa1 family membrane protein insertase